MNKREYAQANKDWLFAKAQEEGVTLLPKGMYYNVLAEGRLMESILRPEASSLHITQDVPSTASSLTVAVAVLRLQSVSATLSRDGSSQCSRCVWATNGRYISLPKWVMASSLNQASPEVPHSYSR